MLEVGNLSNNFVFWPFSKNIIYLVDIVAGYAKFKILVAATSSVRSFQVFVEFQTFSSWDLNLVFWLLSGWGLDVRWKMCVKSVQPPENQNKK